ncbi:MAG: aminotransferase class III-fold pyridoxal phosphate-dependent enzyme [Acidimicrobiia bacterium]|nr:aminotransferase class III-fold pyridoxal phosphate-dependent enzyme [Acidimicrobiia bacterium]
MEQALKIAFQYWWNRGIEGRTGYLALGGSYHGDTVGSLSLGAGWFGTDLFDPLRFPVLRTPGYDEAGWADAAIEALTDHADELAAVVVEPLVQGAAGIQVAEPERLARVVEAARANDVLVIADEVATGFGRTGTLFASERCGIRPDLLCLGKGITGGYLPLVRHRGDRPGPRGVPRPPTWAPRTFYHGHSYSGNALACAVALRHLQLLDEWDVLANVAARSRQLDERVRADVDSHPAVREARLAGLMGGVELAPPEGEDLWGRRVCAASVRHGVLLRPLGDVVVLMPLLTVTEDEIDRIVDTLAELALDEVVLARCTCRRGVDRIDGRLAARSRRARTVAMRRATSTVGGPGADSSSTGARSCPSRPTTISASRPTRRRPTRPVRRSTAGARVPVRPTRRRLTAGARRARGRPRCVEGDRGASWSSPRGFTANLGVLATLGGPGVRVCSDELNHASIIDGCRLAPTPRVRRRIAHRDLEHLRRAARGPRRPVDVVVTDAVFSMDGDVAPLAELASLCREHEALLVVDEAHAVLDLPPYGRTAGRRCVVGTAVQGARHPRRLRGRQPSGSAELLRQPGVGPYIFTTASTPADCRGSARRRRASCAPQEGDRLRARLRGHVDQLAPGHPSPIVPVVVGDEDRALWASDALLEEGLLVPAIRPPTVPPGTSRLRVALSAAHDDDDVRRLAEVLDRLSLRSAVAPA